jgi:hypothetical protein
VAGQAPFASLLIDCHAINEKAMDNGPEYFSGKLALGNASHRLPGKLMESAETWGISIGHIQPGSPGRTPISSATIAPFGMDGLTNKSSKPTRLSMIASNRPPANGTLRISPRNGYGLATMTGRTSLSWFEAKPLPGNGAPVRCPPPGS